MIITSLDRDFRILDMRDGTFVVQENAPWGWRDIATCESLDAAERFVENELAKTPRIVKEYRS